MQTYLDELYSLQTTVNLTLIAARAARTDSTVIDGLHDAADRLSRLIERTEEGISN